MDDAGAKILFIDEDPEFRAAIGAAFEAEGFDFKAVETSVEAMDAMSAGAFDIVIVDGLLPDDTGINLARKVREMPRNENARIIFFSAHFKEASIFKKLKTELGVDLVLHKPFTPEVLINASHGLLETGLRSSADDPFAALRQEYADSFYDKLFAIESIMEKLATGHDSGPLLNGLMFITHKMHGAAGIFGFDLVSVAAAEWERELKALIESGTGVNADILERFHCYYDWLKINFQKPQEVQAISQVTVADEQVYIEPVVAQPEEANEETPANDAAPLDSYPVEIMIVDDDTVVQNLLAYALEIRGLRFESIFDGEVAHRRLLTAGAVLPKLILLDINLPGIDGYTLLRELKASPVCAGIKVIIISARGREEDIVKGFEAGARDYVVKPFSVPILMHKVRLALGVAKK